MKRGEEEEENGMEGKKIRKITREWRGGVKEGEKKNTVRVGEGSGRGNDRE